MNKKLVLSNSNNARSFASSKDEFLQEKAFEKVCQLITSVGNSKTSSHQDDTEFYSVRGHYNILVNGMRGSGKTTFALTAAKMLEAGKGIDGIKKGDIISLGILDPTLIDTKEHVLLAVISKIKEVVSNRVSKKDYPLVENPSIFYNSAHPLDDWNNKLRSLAQGLQQLDGIGQDPMQDSIWEDPITIMQEGLDNIHSGLELNKRLHSFIDASLNILEAKKFILVLDDVDTFFQKGWPVLEALRKFITTPQLISLVCGDFQLYYTQAKRKQWEQLGTLVTQYETDAANRPKYEAMIRTLTEQYLLKVLPANRRVDLQTMADLSSIIVYQNKKDVKNSEGVVLSKYISNMLQESFKTPPNTAEASLFYDFLLHQPMRMVIQMLSSLNNSKQLPVESLQNIFSDWVYRESAASLLQESHTNSLLIQHLLSILCNSGIMSSDLELLPRYINQVSNMGAIVSSRLLCNYFTNNPSAAIDFMIRGGLSRQAIYFIGSNQEKRPSPNEIMLALSATTSDDLLTVTRQWASVAVHGLSNSVNKSISKGTVQILSEGSISKQRSKKALKNLYRTSSPELVRAYADANISTENLDRKSYFRVLADSIKFLNSYYTKFNINKKSHHYALSPIEIKRVLHNFNKLEHAELLGVLFVSVAQGNQNFYRASSLNLIAFMNRLIALTNNDLASFTIERVKFEFQRAGQIRIYPVPVDFSLLSEVNDGRSDEDNEDNESDESNEDNEIEVDTSKLDNSYQENLYTSVFNWLKSWDKEVIEKINYPPFVWSRIWQRFYYGLEQQDNNLNAENKFLGIIIHRQIVLFLNSILVEELRYQKDCRTAGVEQLSVGLDNPINSDEIFTKNIGSIRKKSESLKGDNKLEDILPLYHIISTFPAWYPFLDKNILENASFDKEFSKSFSTIAKITDLSVAGYFPIKDLLNLIPLARADHQTPAIWTHKDIQDILLKNEDIVKVLKSKYGNAKVEKNKIDALIKEHLARTSNEETARKLMDTINKIKGDE